MFIPAQGIQLLQDILMINALPHNDRWSRSRKKSTKGLSRSLRKVQSGATGCGLAGTPRYLALVSSKELKEIVHIPVC